MPSYLAGGHPGEKKNQLALKETAPSALIHAISMTRPYSNTEVECKGTWQV